MLRLVVLLHMLGALLISSGSTPLEGMSTSDEEYDYPSEDGLDDNAMLDKMFDNNFFTIEDHTYGKSRDVTTTCKGKSPCMWAICFVPQSNILSLSNCMQIPSSCKCPGGLRCKPLSDFTDGKNRYKIDHTCQ